LAFRRAAERTRRQAMKVQFFHHRFHGRWVNL
jgi:hypothetical protein